MKEPFACTFQGLFAPQPDLHNFIREISKEDVTELPTCAQLVPVNRWLDQ